MLWDINSFLKYKIPKDQSKQQEAAWETKIARSINAFLELPCIDILDVGLEANLGNMQLR